MLATHWGVRLGILTLAHVAGTVPIVSVIYDEGNRLFGCNHVFEQTFFPESPHIVRPGTPQEFLLRSWAYSQGHDPLVTEAFVQERLSGRPEPTTHFAIRLGEQVIRKVSGAGVCRRTTAGGGDLRRGQSIVWLQPCF